MFDNSDKLQKLLIVLSYIVVVIWLGLVALALTAEAADYIDQKATAHEIAELARSLGLPEDDPIIQRAQQLWWEADAEFTADRDIIATVVYNEAGYGCSDRHMELVAAVVVNRVGSEAFPDTVYDVVTQKNQYHPDYAEADSYYGRRARESDVWAKCQEIAARALLGEVECPDNVVFQAEFVQGSGVYEVHKTSYSTTYFCYGG